jgi:hypothetical protein
MTSYRANVVNPLADAVADGGREDTAAQLPSPPWSAESTLASNDNFQSKRVPGYRPTEIELEDSAKEYVRGDVHTPRCIATTDEERGTALRRAHGLAISRLYDNQSAVACIVRSVNTKIAA